MWNRYAIRPQIVRTNPKPATSDEDARPRMTSEELTALAKENAKNAAIIIGVGYAAKKFIDTASEIALITARATIK